MLDLNLSCARDFWCQNFMATECIDLNKKNYNMCYML